MSARGSALCVDTKPGMAGQGSQSGQSGCLARLAGAWGSLRRALVLREPAGQCMNHLVSFT